MARSSLFGSSTLSDIQETAGRQISDLAEQLTDSDTARRGRRFAVRMEKSAADAVRERPIAALVAVAVIGFALGALWRS